MSSIPSGLPILIFVSPLVASAIICVLPSRFAGRTASTAAFASLLFALLSTADLLLTSFQSPRVGVGVDSFAFRYDAISATMALLVAYLGFVVIRFSRNYLAGDPGQRRFFYWMSLTLASVLLLVTSGNLGVLFAAWVSTSLCLHQLLLFYPDRKGAVFAARKKFVVSRLGDASLLAALALIHFQFGTWDMEQLFALANAGKTEGLPTIGFLLAACAMFKSAQFPFHGWLPDTMETPTPVSAFMHAGIINAGGFLLVRLSPLFVNAEAAMAFIAVIGGLTAAFGAVVMLTQPSVKRSLAYSTVAQMGFMLLQCGLGAFGLALVHIAAHSLYKAHAFLHTGATIGSTPRAAIPLRTSSLCLGLAAGALMVVASAMAGWVAAPALFRPSPVFLLILALALAYGIARSNSAVPTVGFRIIVGFAGLTLTASALHVAASGVYGDLPHELPPGWLLAVIALIFIGLFVFQAFLWRAGESEFGRRMYVHALNGFYVGTFGNRLLGFLWPHRTHLKHRARRTSDSPLPVPVAE